MDDDPKRTKALDRYKVISAYLALDPQRGKCGPLREQLAGKTWMSDQIPGGRPAGPSSYAGGNTAWRR